MPIPLFSKDSGPTESNRPQSRLGFIQGRVHFVRDHSLMSVIESQIPGHTHSSSPAVTASSSEIPAVWSIVMDGPPRRAHSTRSTTTTTSSASSTSTTATSTTALRTCSARASRMPQWHSCGHRKLVSAWLWLSRLNALHFSRSLRTECDQLRLSRRRIQRSLQIFCAELSLSSSCNFRLSLQPTLHSFLCLSVQSEISRNEIHH